MRYVFVVGDESFIYLRHVRFWRQASVIVLGDVLADRSFKLGIVGTLDLVHLLTFVIEDEAGAAGELAELQAVDDILGNTFFTGTVELHAQEILVEAQEQIAVVLLHCLATAAPTQVQIDA